MNNLRSQFPILKNQLNGHDLVYLDSAATSQKPQEVIDAMTDFYTNHNASSHSVHSLGGRVTEMVEQTRQVVADFIGSVVDEVVFTSGATEGINLIVNGFLEMSLRSVSKVEATSATLLSVLENTPSSFTPHVTPIGLSRQPLIKEQFLPNLSQTHQTGSFGPLKMIDVLTDKFKLDRDSEILICVDQHHSNILPWQRLAELVGCKIVFFGILASGRWDLSDFESKLNNHTKVIAISNVSNVLGVVQDVGEVNKIVSRIFSLNVTPVSLGTASPLSRGNLPTTIDTRNFKFNRPIVVLDATQAVSHFPVDVKELDVDFLVFSGHKVYGPTGVGVLYGRRELLEVLPSYKVGGDMVESVSLNKNIYKESPFRFEAGTANFSSIIGLKAALDWFIRSQDEIFEVEDQLLEYLIEKLSEVEGLQVLSGIEVKDYPVTSQQSLDRGNLSLGRKDSFDFDHVANPRQALHATPFASGNLPLELSHSGTGSFAPLKMTKNSNFIPKIPLASFNIEGINPLDLALLLDQKGICVRSGQHCAGILHEYLSVDSSCRISLACYNTFEELDFVIKSIKNAIKILK
jgi:selenocysteine lyase/cysteine desulfurase